MHSCNYRRLFAYPLTLLPKSTNSPKIIQTFVRKSNHMAFVWPSSIFFFSSHGTAIHILRSKYAEQRIFIWRTNTATALMVGLCILIAFIFRLIELNFAVSHTFYFYHFRCICFQESHWNQSIIRTSSCIEQLREVIIALIWTIVSQLDSAENWLYD